MLLQHILQIFRQVLDMTGPTSAVHNSGTAFPVPSTIRGDDFKILCDKTEILGFKRFQSQLGP